MTYSSCLFLLFGFLSGFGMQLYAQDLKELRHEQYGFGFGCSYNEDLVKEGSLNEDLLAVYKLIDGTVSLHPMAGHYVKSERFLCFYPAFNLRASERYLIRYMGKEQVYIPTETIAEALPVLVQESFPVAEEIPENTLCFYLKFNQPMQPDPNAYRFVDLVDAKGNKQDDVWRQRSFWFQDQTILVLMLHPGRVKHGIAATRHLDKLLETGDFCYLRLNPGLKAMSGAIFEGTFEKKYKIGAADKAMPEAPVIANKKKLHANDSLYISFKEAMDIGLAYKHLSVENDQGKVEGKWHTSNGMDWVFVPDTNWKKGKYALVYSSKLSDLARNELDRLFEPSSLVNFGSDVKSTQNFWVR